jgi:hypothetical protein
MYSTSALTRAEKIGSGLRRIDQGRPPPYEGSECASWYSRGSGARSCGGGCDRCAGAGAGEGVGRGRGEGDGGGGGAAWFVDSGGGGGGGRFTCAKAGPLKAHIPRTSSRRIRKERLPRVLLCGA